MESTTVVAASVIAVAVNEIAELTVVMSPAAAATMLPPVASSVTAPVTFDDAEYKKRYPTAELFFVRSTDGGRTWQALGENLAAYPWFYDVAVDRFDGTRLPYIDNLHPDDQQDIKQDNNKFIRFK